MSNTTVYIGGKSGGHIIPCLTLAKHAQQRHNTHIIFIAADTALDRSILEKQNNVTRTFFLPFFSVKKTVGNVCAFFYSIVMCIYIIIRYRPNKVVSSGGALSLPMCIVAYVYGITIELYELNAIPGKAILFLSRFATTLFVCFSKTKAYFQKNHTVVTHYPVRYTTTNCISKEAACTQLQLSHSLTTIMVIGGSQGSQFLNRLLLNKKLLSLHEIQIIHLVGNNDPEYYKQQYKAHTIPHFVTSYTDNMIPLYSIADIVISRAGAGTLAELLFFKKETIIIPLSTVTTSHQIDNARAYTQEHSQLFCMLDEQVIENDYAVFLDVLQKKVEKHQSYKQTIEQKKDNRSCPL